MWGGFVTPASVNRPPSSTLLMPDSATVATWSAPKIRTDCPPGPAELDRLEHRDPARRVRVGFAMADQHLVRPPASWKILLPWMARAAGAPSNVSPSPPHVWPSRGHGEALPHSLDAVTVHKPRVRPRCVNLDDLCFPCSGVRDLAVVNVCPVSPKRMPFSASESTPNDAVGNNYRGRHRPPARAGS